MDSPNRNKLFYYAALSVLFLSALFFCFYQTEPSSLWTDEFATLWVANAPSLSECIQRSFYTQGQSPFFFIFEWGVLKILPVDELSLRLISGVSYILSALLVFYLVILFFRLFPVLKPEEPTECNPASNQIFPAFVASLLFVMNRNIIYYAQEARPYAMALLFAICSQVFFLRMIAKPNTDQKKTENTGNGVMKLLLTSNTLLYILFSALVCYTHYIVGTVILTQNIWVLILLLHQYRKRRKNGREKFLVKGLFSLNAGGILLKGWIFIQLLLIVALLPLFYHINLLLSQQQKWNWLYRGGITYLTGIFLTLLDPKLLLFMASLTLFAISAKNLVNPAKCAKVPKVVNSVSFSFILLFIWLIIPPLFAYFATLFMNASLMDSRYMILALIPLFMLFAQGASKIPSGSYMRPVFILLFVGFFLLHSLLPDFLRYGRFTERIPHDWRKAVGYLDKHYKRGDAVVLRSGFIKANWLAVPKNEKDKDIPGIIREYVEYPLSSFYAKNLQNANIANLTFSPSREFRNYYKSLYNKCSKADRIWIIGVSAPNGFPIQNIPQMFSETHIIVFQKDYTGVYLALMLRKSVTNLETTDDQ